MRRQKRAADLQRKFKWPSAAIQEAARTYHDVMDALAPIQERNPTGVHEPTVAFMAARDLLDEEVKRHLSLLYDHYSLPSNEPASGEKLAYLLARDLIEHFDPYESLPKGTTRTLRGDVWEDVQAERRKGSTDRLKPIFVTLAKRADYRTREKVSTAQEIEQAYYRYEKEMKRRLAQLGRFRVAARGTADGGAAVSGVSQE